MQVQNQERSMCLISNMHFLASCACLLTRVYGTKLENVEHCGGEPEQAATRLHMHMNRLK